jgi:hypothetical protein
MFENVRKDKSSILYCHVKLGGVGNTAQSAVKETWEMGSHGAWIRKGFEEGW